MPQNGQLLVIIVFFFYHLRHLFELVFVSQGHVASDA